MAGMDHAVINARMFWIQLETQPSHRVSISAAALTVLALFAAYAEVIEARGIPLVIDLRNPPVIAGVLWEP